MRDVRDAWVCELPGCGGAWLAKSDVAPEKCGKCRKRGWHLTKTTNELIREKAPDLDDRVRRIVLEEIAKAQVGPKVARNVPDRRHNVPESVPEILPPSAKPDVDTLRAICDGDFIRTAPLSLAAHVQAEPQTEHCPYTEWDPETGETYACGLHIHSPKVKHTRGYRC